MTYFEFRGEVRKYMDGKLKNLDFFAIFESAASIVEDKTLNFEEKNSLLKKIYYDYEDSVISRNENIEDGFSD